ncbi:MAG: hypothetical protein QM679_03305 [Patulibacter sp.]
MGWLRNLVGAPGPTLVRVAVARHQPEAELLLSLLHDARIPARTRRSAGFDVPDMLAAGPRDILVPEHLEAEARAVIEPIIDADAPGAQAGPTDA